MIWYDVVGYISIIFSIIAFLSKSKKKMRINGAISATFFGISIYGYAGYNGVFVSLISVIIKLLSLKYKEEKLKILKIASVPVAIIFYLYINKEGLYGILPAISLIFITFADTQKDLIKMKIIYIGSAISWLIYAIIISSMPAIIYDIVGLVILAYSILEIKRDRIKENEG